MSTVLVTGGSGFVGSHCLLQLLGKKENATNAKARRVLGWSPRSTEESVDATGESLIRLSLLKY